MQHKGPAKMSTYPAIFTYGFAMFAMFFGSGNLVFPLQIGQIAGAEWGMGFLGLLLTGIILPFLGLFVIKLHHGNYLTFFGEAGRIAKVILPLFTLSLLGAFGVVPRCITVAYGGMNYVFPDLSLLVFSGVFCAILFLLCLKDRLMVKVLGEWMSPLLLVSLSILIGMGVWKAPAALTEVSPYAAFSNGFLMGYQTMDLFAAFFFSALIFSQVQQIMPPSTHVRDVIRFAVKPSLVGASLLALAYLGFVYLGAHYGRVIQGIAPELMLPTIAMRTMGPYATLVIGVAMIFSCLTTAVALNNIYARYLCSFFPSPRGEKEETYFVGVLAGTTLVSFILSLLDFRGIAAFLAPALEASYPGLIALTVMSIWVRKKTTLKKTVFYALTASMVIYTLLQ